MYNTPQSRIIPNRGLFWYSPKTTTMKLTITDDIEAIAESFESIQGSYVSLGSFSDYFSVV